MSTRWPPYISQEDVPRFDQGLEHCIDRLLTHVEVTNKARPGRIELLDNIPGHVQILTLRFSSIFRACCRANEKTSSEEQYEAVCRHDLDRILYDCFICYDQDHKVQVVDAENSFCVDQCIRPRYAFWSICLAC